MPIMRYLLVTFVGMAIFTLYHCNVEAATKKEIEYTREWCWPKGWEVGHIIKEGGVKVAEVDCLGPTYAVETDRAYKYYEAVGQSLRYAVLTGQLPGILLIVGPDDEKYVKRLKEIIKGAFLPIKVWTVAK